MSCSRMAAKTLLRPAQDRGHLGLVGGLLQVAEPLDLPERREHGEVDRAGDLVDVALLQVERRGGLELREEALVGALGDLQPHRGPPLAPSERLLDGREQAAADLGLLDGQVAVPGDAEGDRRRDAEAAEEGIEPRADHVLEQDEPPLTVGLVGQCDQAVQHRGDLEHRVQLAGRATCRVSIRRIRFRLLLWRCGNGCAGSIASGVSTGYTWLSKYSSR